MIRRGEFHPPGRSRTPSKSTKRELSSLDLDLRTVGDAFVAEIKTIFEPWQLAEYLATARQTEPFDPDIYEGEDPEYIEMERQDDLRRSAADLLLVERAKEWLLEDGNG